MVSKAAEVQVCSASPWYLTSAIGRYGGRCGASQIVLVGKRWASTCRLLFYSYRIINVQLFIDYSVPCGD